MASDIVPFVDGGCACGLVRYAGLAGLGLQLKLSLSWLHQPRTPGRTLAPHQLLFFSVKPLLAAPSPVTVRLPPASTERAAAANVRPAEAATPTRGAPRAAGTATSSRARQAGRASSRRAMRKRAARPVSACMWRTADGRRQSAVICRIASRGPCLPATLWMQHHLSRCGVRRRWGSLTRRRSAAGCTRPHGLTSPPPCSELGGVHV